MKDTEIELRFPLKNPNEVVKKLNKIAKKAKRQTVTDVEHISGRFQLRSIAAGELGP